jgi:hypothetical protein
MKNFNFKLLILFSMAFYEASAAISWSYGADGPWAMNCDFLNNDLSNVRSSGEECSTKCRTTSGCTHYTWTNWNGGTCWMKKGQVSQSNAFYSTLGFVCGVLNTGSFGSGVGNTYWGVLATRHGANEIGACELPDGNYAVYYPFALGDISSLGDLRFRSDLCGKVLRINCGNGDIDIVVTNSNLGGGLDLYASTWSRATNNKPPGETSCRVQLTDRNMMNGNQYKCYHATGEVWNPYYRNVGLFNTNNRIVKRAVFNGREGQHRGSNPYYAFDGYGTGNDQVTFYFEDGGSHSVYLQDCASGANKKYWS